MNKIESQKISAAHDEFSDKLVSDKINEKTMTEENLNKTMTESSATVYTRESFFERIKPYHGSFSDESLFKMIVRPFFLLINPVVAWSILIVSFCSVWVIGISLVIAQIFSAPPYLLNTAQLGYIAFGPVVGGLLGCILCGALSDPIARWMTRRNNGVYEPEFRLPLMLLLPIVSTIGYFIFGNAITQGKSPIAAAAMWGLVFVSVQVAAVSTGMFFNACQRRRTILTEPLEVLISLTLSGISASKLSSYP